MKKTLIIALVFSCFVFLIFSGKVSAATTNLKGKILLQVQRNGEAWYVNPQDGQRYFLGRPADAFAVMRSLGTGISNKDLNKIGLPGMPNKDAALAKRLAGRIVLQVEGKGEAYYINPVDLNRYYLGRPDDAFSVMRSKGLGISNADLNKIVVSKNNYFPAPKVDLYVMSYCPYALQMEKGILPVIAKLGSNIDFKLKFIDYAMHGQRELTENTTQYCIETEQKDKLLAYLDCFLGAGESDVCLVKSKVSLTSLEACRVRTDDKYAISQGYENKDTWLNGSFPVFAANREDVKKFSVMGSPTLIINDKIVSLPRDSAVLLDGICQSFIVPPDACSAKMSTTTPNPGFGALLGSGLVFQHF